MAQADAHHSRTTLSKSLPIDARHKIAAAVEAHLAAVEALTSVLDRWDAPSEDLEAVGDDEPAGDELDTSYPENYSNRRRPSLGIKDGGAGVGFLGLVEDAEDGGDAEPSLGARNPAGYGNGVSQTDWGQGAADDREEDRCEDEPSLGWTIDGVFGRTDDQEEAARL